MTFTKSQMWCQEDLNSFPFGELEETTRTPSYYVDEDYPARAEIKQSLTGWGDNCGSESSTLETDVCVWRYAPLVVLATQEEEQRWNILSLKDKWRRTRTNFKYLFRQNNRPFLQLSDLDLATYLPGWFSWQAVTHSRTNWARRSHYIDWDQRITAKPC